STPALDELTYATFVGSWKIDYGDGEGDLQIKAPVSGTGNFTGTYTDSSGHTSAVTGKVQDNRRGVSFSITTAAGGTQTFTGNLHTWKKGIISGYTTLNNRKYGFVATRGTPKADLGIITPGKFQAGGSKLSLH
ncbi:MAG TPA: hypothetical protein PLQ33_04785, partial [Peptococcaceae bacterium]|nr:hypothetical protein [Peptococcaceae bacterium]